MRSGVQVAVVDGWSWENGLVNAAAGLGRRQGEGRANRRRQSRISPEGANSVRDGAHARRDHRAASALSDCELVGFQDARPHTGPL